MAHFNVLARVSAAVLAVAAFSSVSGATYTLVDLGTGVAKDVNASGRVVGNAGTGGWYYDGTNRITLKFQTHFLGTPLDQLLLFTASTANSINDNGRIAGSIIFVPLQEATRTAYFTDDGAIATLLETGDGNALNRNGVLVGGNPGFVLTGSNVRFQTGTTPVLSAINDSALAVGSTLSNGVEVATSFNGNTVTRLALQGLGLPAGDYESSATSLNNSGQIVGNVRLRTGANPRPKYGFLQSGGSTINLGNLGGNSVLPQDINTTGTVVGSATTDDGSAHAFVFDDGQISDLNFKVTGAFGWVLVSANAVNDRGWIVGEGRKEGAQRSFLLKPVGAAPSISAHPVNARAFIGGNLSLSVSATGSPPLSYQWRHAGTNIPGAIASSFLISNAVTNNSGLYSVLVSNDFGSASSNDADLDVEPLDAGPVNLAVGFYAGVKIPGPVGRKYRIEAADNAADTSWETLETVTLNVTPYLWVDSSTPNHAGRLYRAVLVP